MTYGYIIYKLDSFVFAYSQLLYSEFELWMYNDVQGLPIKLFDYGP